MKTITFEGKQYEVEDWVKWACRDLDGSIWGYENRPRPLTNDWYVEGRKTILTNGWQDSLTEV